MNRLIFFLIFCFLICSLSANPYHHLYNDLLNLWTLGRNSEFILFDFDDPYLEYGRGAFIYTGNELDFLIGRGFFVVYDEINDTTYLTRNGRFNFNLRGILVNEDGYYVMNPENQFIYQSDFNFKFEYFNDLFLVVVPDNDNLVVTSKYVISSSYKRTRSAGSNEVLESIPVSLFDLVDHALLHIEENMDFENKEGLINLMYKRYFEVIELNNRFITAGSPYHLDSESLEELRNKIETIERKLLNNSN